MVLDSCAPHSASRDPQPRRVLLLTASVGAGHNQAARALRETLTRSASNLHVECWDVLEYTPWRFRAKYARGYAFSVSHLPRLYGLGFACTDHPRGPKRTLLERRRLWSESRVLRKLGQAVEAFKSDLIVHTHFLAPPFLHRLGERRGRPFRQIIVTTDVIPHRWWYCEEAEQYFTAHESGRERLIELGAPAERIVVSGMPIHPKWTAPLPEREAICKAWSLPTDRPIVLLSGGTDFTCGPIVSIARGLAKTCPRACVVVLGGRNKKLLGRLAKLPETRDGHIVPQGFTDRLPELAEVAGVMITKAGGLTTAECLAKRLPMIFLRPVPGQEESNAKFFMQHGAGRIAHNTRAVVKHVEDLLASPDELQTLSDAARRLYQPGETTITEAILRNAE